MFKDTFPLQAYINLDSREDRNKEAIEEFTRIGLNPIRKSGFVPEFNFDRYSRGVVGCWVSHYQILTAAAILGTSVFIFEDDVKFVNNPMMKMSLACEELKNFEWDILYLGANILKPFHQVSPHLAKLTHCQSTVAYGVNGKFIPKLLEYIDPNHITRPIDVVYSELAQVHNFYITVPMLAIQRDSFSDIEGTDVNYSSYLQKRYDENLVKMA